MRLLACLVLVAACTAEPPPPDLPQPLDVVWGQSIRPGDVIVAVPGTGGYTLLGAFIDAAVDPAQPDAPPVIDQRTTPDLNPIVLEQAIAAAQRAGLSDAEIEQGAVAMGLWGAGVTKAGRFDYHSLGGLTVRFDVIGGRSVCADGSLPENLLHYTKDNADADARDLATRIATYLGGSTRQVTVVSHSWGGAVSEYFVQNLATPGVPAFVIAAGVPPGVPGYDFAGPGLRPVAAASLYEVDRPDDPVHALDFGWDLEGHQYDIVIAGQFVGSYGITTEELSCHGNPGPCPH